jgi:hypothetical protein
MVVNSAWALLTGVLGGASHGTGRRADFGGLARGTGRRDELSAGDAGAVVEASPALLKVHHAHNFAHLHQRNKIKWQRRRRRRRRGGGRRRSLKSEYSDVLAGKQIKERVALVVSSS